MFALSSLLTVGDVAGLAEWVPWLQWIVLGALGVALLVLFVGWLTVRYIPNQQVGIVEKLWSSQGSVPEGSIIALHGEAGYQADLLRGGVHFGLWRWQYRVHRVLLVTIAQGKIGYVYARDGEAMSASQTLGRVVACNHFQDAHAFLGGSAEEGTEAGRGQRGRTCWGPEKFSFWRAGSSSSASVTASARSWSAPRWKRSIRSIRTRC
jgi:hypothetical protein